MGRCPQEPVGHSLHAGQGAIPRSKLRHEAGGVAKHPLAKPLRLETVLELSRATALREEDINLDPHLEAPPPPTAHKPQPPLDVKTLQDQLQQLRIGPAKSSTPCRGAMTPPPEAPGLPTPITTKPTGTIPKPGIQRTELDNDYQPVVPQPGGNPNPLVRTNISSKPLNPESDSDTSSETSGMTASEMYRTAFDTAQQAPQIPAVNHYTTEIQEISSTLPLNLDNEPETGMGRLNAVIRELFGRDTIKAALMERASVNWIKVESQWQAEQQMAWYQQFHPGTRYHTGYIEESEEEEDPKKTVVPAIGLKTAAGGGGDPNDPDDDPR